MNLSIYCRYYLVLNRNLEIKPTTPLPILIEASSNNNSKCIIYFKRLGELSHIRTKKKRNGSSCSLTYSPRYTIANQYCSLLGGVILSYRERETYVKDITS